jgi:VWFA-related protein
VKLDISFMRYKSTFNLISFVLFIGIIFISNQWVFAQKSIKEQNKKKDFGWSLKKFEKKEKDSSKDEQTNLKNSEQSEVSEDETVRIETNLVINDVLVINEKGNAILGLGQSDFIITEDGEPQKIELFSFGENAALPRSIVLIYRSVSPTKFKWIRDSLETTKVLVDKLATQDKMAIVTPDLKLILDFTQDKVLLKKTLEKLSSNRNAKPFVNYDYGTLMAVLDEMFDEKDVRPIVIFQAHGRELDLLKEEFLKLPGETQDFWERHKQKYEHQFGGERGYSFSDVLERVEKSRATIYSIIPAMQFVGLPRDEQLRRARINIEEWMRIAVREKDSNRISAAQNQYQSVVVDDHVLVQTAMMQVAKLSGGYTEFVEQPEDAQRVYETIFKVINNRYTIGYYSTNQTRDGKRRNVKIEVRNHPEYIIVGRNSYIAAEGKK